MTLIRAVKSAGGKGHFVMTGDAERAARITLVEELSQSITAARRLAGPDGIVSLPLTVGAERVLSEALSLYWTALFRAAEEDAEAVAEPTGDAQ